MLRAIWIPYKFCICLCPISSTRNTGEREDSVCLTGPCLRAQLVLQVQVTFLLPSLTASQRLWPSPSKLRACLLGDWQIPGKVFPMQFPLFYMHKTVTFVRQHHVFKRPVMELLNCTLTQPNTLRFFPLAYMLLFSEQVVFRDTPVTSLKSSLQSWGVSSAHQWCWESLWVGSIVTSF